MLSLFDLQMEIARYRYKPGWTFEVYAHPFEGGEWLKIETTQPDSYNPEGDRVPLVIRSAIPPMNGPESFGVWLLWRLQMVEIHETCEFLKRGDKHVHDPHSNHEEYGL